MKRLLFFLVFFAPALSFAAPDSTPIVADSLCEKIPPGITETELSNFVCVRGTGEWISITELDASDTGLLAQAGEPPAAAPSAEAAPAPKAGELKRTRITAMKLKAVRDEMNRMYKNLYCN